MTTEETKRLLGEVVIVRLDKAVVFRGRLLGFGECGEFEILDESNGCVHYCWPMLEIDKAET